MNLPLEPMVETLTEKLIDTVSEMVGDIWESVDATTKQRDIESIKLCSKFLILGLFSESNSDQYTYFAEASRAFRTIRADILAEVESYKRELANVSRSILVGLVIGLAKGVV